MDKRTKEAAVDNVLTIMSQFDMSVDDAVLTYLDKTRLQATESEERAVISACNRELKRQEEAGKASLARDYGGSFYGSDDLPLFEGLRQH